MNSNMIHNILNAAIALIGSALAFDWSVLASWLSVEQIATILAALGFLKLVINAVRDGFLGLFKQQPPVADSMTSVIVTKDTGAPATKVEVIAPAATLVDNAKGKTKGK